MNLVGITGTNGAGKGAIVEYLTSLSPPFVHLSMRTYLTDVILERNGTVNRDSMVLVANELRAKNGPSYLAEQLLEKAIEQLQRGARGVIIESIRTIGEVEVLKSSGLVLISVDAKPEVRYERVVLRQSSTDQISYITFVSDEKREMQNEEPHKQNLQACIQRADHSLMNNGTLEELHVQLGKLLISTDPRKRRLSFGIGRNLGLGSNPSFGGSDGIGDMIGPSHPGVGLQIHSSLGVPPGARFDLFDGPTPDHLPLPTIFLEKY